MPAIVDLREQLNGAYPTRLLSNITMIVIHHTGAEADSTPEQIDAYHKSLGWSAIGYHLVVRQDGTVYYCGDVNTTRAHIYGLNPVTVGIVLTGDFTYHSPSIKQLDGARAAIAFVRGKLSDLPVKGHKDMALPESPTSCPGSTWDEWRDYLV